jgi:multiple sugar transport system permease protein
MLARRYVYRVIGLLVLLVFVAFFGVPLVWLLLAPTKTDHQLVHESPFAFGSLSTFGHTFHRVINYQGQLMLTWLKNSAIYSFGGTALALLAAIPAGYGLALTQFIGRRALLAITLVVMIMPATALVLPLFLEASAVHLVGTDWSVILPFAFFPFGVYLAYIYFSSTIPKDLLAAARIDGATEWGVFRHVALPLARPIVALVAFFAFVADWNNYYLPFVMTYTSSQYPVTIGLQILIGSAPVFSPTASGYSASEIYRPDLAMATLIAILPIIIIFLFAQRTLVKGMLAGATKG